MWRSTFVPETIFRRSIRCFRNDPTSRVPFTFQLHFPETFVQGKKKTWMLPVCRITNSGGGGGAEFAVIACSRSINMSELTSNKTRQHFCKKYAFIEKLENLLFVYKVINNDTESATAFCYVSSWKTLSKLYYKKQYWRNRFPSWLIFLLLLLVGYFSTFVMFTLSAQVQVLGYRRKMNRMLTS